MILDAICEPFHHPRDSGRGAFTGWFAGVERRK